MSYSTEKFTVERISSFVLLINKLPSQHILQFFCEMDIVLFFISHSSKGTAGIV
jgi:hypothetical protein